MKNYKNFKAIVVAFVMIATTVSCNNDDDTSSPSESLLEVARNQTSLSTFVQAIEIVGAEGSFESNQNFTILAPNNAAFNEFFTENGYSGIDAIPVATLREIVYNHMIDANLQQNQFAPGYIKTNATGSASASNNLDLFVDISEGVLFNGVSEIITPNLNARNGSLHIVDGVLNLPTLLTHIRANTNFSMLAEAIVLNPSSNFTATLEGTNGSPFTVFAPTNQAFTAVLEELNLDSISEIPADQLEDILSYHIVSGNNYMVSSLTNNQSIATLQGQDLVVTLTGGGRKLTDTNGRVANLIVEDVQASNGIIHYVDKVLLPL